MAVAVRLPLFPLGTVLFPGLVLPLHVFEERYRVLVQALMALPDQAPRHFGVVAIRAGREVGTDGARALHGVGCTAELREVTPYEDGRFEIVTTGTQRFRLLGIDRDAGTPYATGLVELLSEPDGADHATLVSLRAQVAARFAAYQQQVGVEATGGVLPEEPRVMSYLVAAAVVLDLADRQNLLEHPDTASRLTSEVGLLRRETALIGEFASLPATELTRTVAFPN